MQEIRVRKDANNRLWAYCPTCHVRGEIVEISRYQYKLECLDNPEHDVRGRIFIGYLQTEESIKNLGVSVL